MRQYLTTFTASLLLSFSLIGVIDAHHRLDHPVPPGQQKLAFPEEVTCPLTEDGLLVSWSEVDGAASYQVEYIAVDQDMNFLRESEFVEASPVLLMPADVTIIAVHVRGLPAPKHEGQTFQAGGPKGEWSSICLVEFDEGEAPEEEIEEEEEAV